MRLGPILAFLSSWTLALPAAAQVTICNEDGSCAFPETCNTCPDECGSCDVADLVGQQAKYVDGSCQHPGDGLSDGCASGPGQPGRFNDLQAALDTLAAGDTLYVHPGDYFRPGDAFRIQGVGTASAPIVITAADPSQRPVLHSWDPTDPTDNALSHPALGGAEEPIAHVVVDHLEIRGLLWIHGDFTRVQNVVCSHGWEVCDGNWSCIRLEYCNDCVAHHNLVRDVVDTTGHCASSPNPPREAGFKEFNGVRTIWELNTVVNTAHWGYDLHRSSVDSIARFNLFRNAGPNTSIRMNRTGNQSVYGNVVIGGGGCVELVSEDPGDGYSDLVAHNTCLFTSAGLYLSPHAPATVTHNVLGFLDPGNADLVNLALPTPADGVPHFADRNAYDASSLWVTEIYEAPYAATLAEWQAATDYDDASIAAPSGPCAFVDAPESEDDDTFDLTIERGACATLSEAGGPIGACAIAPCVGWSCEGCGDAPIVEPSGGGGAGGTGSGAGAGASAAGPTGSGTASGGGSGADVDPDAEDGCSCRAAPGVDAPRGTPMDWLPLPLLVAWVSRRRVRRARIGG